MLPEDSSPRSELDCYEINYSNRMPLGNRKVHNDERGVPCACERFVRTSKWNGCECLTVMGCIKCSQQAQLIAVESWDSLKLQLLL